MSPTIFLITISLFFGTIILIFAMRYFSANRQARQLIANDAAYRELAAKAVTSQADNTALLTIIQGAVSDIKLRLAAVEKVLAEV